MQSIKRKRSNYIKSRWLQKEPWVSPLDIADAIIEEMELPFEGRTIRYIASDEVSPKELVEILSKAKENQNLKIGSNFK